jgi:hypothetical protein
MLLLISHAGVGVTAEQWRNMQLNGLVSDQYVLPAIRSHLREFYPDLDSLTAFTECIATFHYKKYQERLVVSIDEANILISKFAKIFSRPSDSTKKDRPLWSLVASKIHSIMSVAVITAGTRMRLHDKEIWLSSLAKYGVSAGQKLILKTNFRFDNHTQT